MPKVATLLLIILNLPTSQQTFPDFHPLSEADHFVQTSIRIDSLAKHLILLGFDDEGVPLYYKSDINTEVCQSDDCKPIRVTVFWNLVGDYIKYDVPNNHPFTKMDHEEFVLEDYQKLHRILSNSKSVLSNYQLEDLVSNKTGLVHKNVDGISGATIKTVKNDVIEGAAYTCHSLWHLVHGEESQFLAFTESLLNRKLGCQLLKSSDVVRQRLAMSYVGANDTLTDCEVTALWSIIASENVFLAQQALTLLSIAALESEYADRAFWWVFTELPYLLQSTAMNKFKNESHLSPNLRHKIALLYQTASYQHCQEILKVLGKEESWDPKIYDGLLKGLKNREKPYRDLLIDYLKRHTSVPEVWLAKIIEDYEE